MPRHSRFGLLGVVLIVAGCSRSGGSPNGNASSGGGTTAAASTSGSGTGSGTAAATATAPVIDTVFIICKENHTFDNLFGSYPGADATMTAKDSHGTSQPLIRPWTDLDFPGLNFWDTAHADWNGGRMDSFDLGQAGSWWSLIALLFHGPFVSYAPSNGTTGGAAGYYWELAKAGTLCDGYFTSVMGPSTPNHLFLYAASSGGCATNPDSSGMLQVVGPGGKLVPHVRTFSSSEIPTALPNELEKKGRTWKVYQELAGPQQPPLAQVLSGIIKFDESIKMIDVVRALPSYPSNYVETGDLDEKMDAFLARGDIGNVTWIQPNGFNSEHPGMGGVAQGAEWTRRIVNAIGKSSYWSHCAIFVTWDDYGGFYDHVPPPQVDALGFGFRVPCLVVSPYAKKGFVDHTPYEHSSIVRYAEDRLGVAPMTARDAVATGMSGAFDMKQTPRSFQEFFFEH